jgi:hypothetical protein
MQEELNKEQLRVNQIAIDLIYEYYDSENLYDSVDAKGILKYLWNKGLKVVSRYPVIYNTKEQ